MTQYRAERGEAAVASRMYLRTLSALKLEADLNKVADEVKFEAPQGLQSRQTASALGYAASAWPAMKR